MEPTRAMCPRILFCVVLILSWISESSGAAPTFDNLGVNINVAENTAATTSIYQLQATDPDGDPLNFLMTSTGVPFNLVGQELQVNGALDFEGTTSYPLDFSVDDGTATVTGSLTVDLTNVNEAPTIGAGGLSINIDEEEAVSTVVLFTFAATDVDAGDTLTYTLSGSDSAHFSMESNNGTVKIAQRLDRETKTEYNQLLLTVTDTGSLFVTASLTVSLDDINDFTPSCSQTAYFATVAENSAVDTAVKTVTCTDGDSSATNNVVTVTITSGDDVTPKFKITGQDIATTGTPTDYETITTYTLIITATDSGATPKFSTATVIVTIDPVNEADPAWGTFAPPTAPYSVSENDALGTVIVTLAATDADTGSDGDIAFSLVSTVDSTATPVTDKFEVDASSGALTKKSALDRETMASYSVTVRASDGGTPTPKSVEQTFTINVADFNDEVPVFGAASYSGSLLETATTGAGVSVLTVAATDGDATSTLTYEIEEGDTTRFQFSGAELQLKTAIDLDDSANDPDYYAFKLIVKDGGTPELTGTVTATVSITAVNEHDPVIDAAFPKSVSFAEDTALGTTIETVVASDADFGSDGDIAFSLTGGNVASAFAIDATSGEITLEKSLDFETTPGYLLEVTVKDGGATVRSATTVVNVSVTNINEAAPACPSSIHETMSESSTATYVVTTVSCPDADTDTVTYSIFSGNGGGEFGIDSASGVITLATSTDYETKTSHTLVIHAVDSGTTQKTGSTSVIITISPENEADPAWSANVPTAPAVAENEGPGTSVVTIAATDTDDGADGTITYSLVSTTDAGGASVTDIFKLESNVLKTFGAMDRESSDSYDVTVRASDGGSPPRTVDQTITITITDYNDEDPVFTGTPYSRTIAESATTAAGVSIVTVAATDADATSTLTYEIEVGDTARFQFSGAELQLKTAINLDQPTNDPSYYLLRIIAKDGGTPERTGTTSVTVSVTAVNDHDPVIGAGFPSTPSFAENTPVGSLIETVIATDLDVGTDGDITFSITSGNTNTDFEIDASSGKITNKNALDFENVPSYTLEVTASDGGSPPKVVTTTVTVTITDVNEADLYCPTSADFVDVPESSAATYLVTTVSCVDPDGDTITYSILSGNGDGKFALDGTTGALTLAATTDYETTTKYTLVVKAEDDGTPVSSASTSVIVSITPVNEADPAWSPNSPVTPVISENANDGTTVVTIAATDADDGADGEIQYSLISTVDSTSSTVTGIFHLDPLSGVLTKLTAMDRETVDSYDVTVRASDGGTPSRSVDQTITITVSDYNDEVPVFTGAPFSKTLSETATTGAGVSVLTVAATDGDATSTLTYEIEDGDTTRFQFSGTELQLKTAIDLDDGVNDPNYYLLRIIAKDGGTPELTGTTSVTVVITAANEHDPVFGGGFPSFETLPESTGVGALVTTVLATDQDYGIDGDISFSITNGDAGNDFTIGPTSGKITLQNALNFETTPSYALEVTAYDGGTSQRSATTTVNVTVTDVNDNAPSCPSYIVYATVAEDAAVNDAVTSLGCTDGDGDTLTHTFTSGNGDGKFDIDGATGAITLAALVDYDSATTRYTLAVDVTDGSNSVTLQVTVDVTAVNEATPTFATPNPSVNVLETASIGTVVHTYTAADTDYSPHDVTTYAITAVTQSGTSKFRIDPASAVISLAETVDYDTLPAGTKYYVITLTATDGGGLKGTGTVTVNVDDVNDNAPSCSPSSHTLTVDEDTAQPTTIIADLLCSDAEDGTSLTYTMTQTPGTNFDVTAAGAVRLTSALDFESNPAHTLTVTIQDGGTPSQSTVVTVNVNVGNVNEGPPTFTGVFTTNILESASPGAIVIDVVATDPDGTNSFGDPVYSIVGGDINNKFTIDPSSGRITTIGFLDREVDASYELVVQAKESGDVGTATVTATITIDDVDDNPPTCGQTSFITTISETDPATTAVHTMSCSLLPDTTGTLTYALTSGDTTKFEVSGNVLQLKAPLDFDAGVTQYNVILTVSDSTNSVVITGTVQVSSVNEASPVFSSVIYSKTFAEDTALATTIATVVATDADSSSNADGQITYAFDASYPLFTLDSTSGLITLASALDWESGPTHDLLVTASDGTNTVTATVSVTVTDVNEHNPVFVSPPYSGTVSEGDAAGASVIVTVAATDADDAATADNGVVTYSIIAGDPMSDFSIDANNGELTTAKALDYETTTSYALTVQAIDRGGDAQSKSATSVITVTVTPVNEFDPVPTPTSVSKSIPESTAVGTLIHTVVATDADNGVDGDLIFTMPTHAKFDLSSTGGLTSTAAFTALGGTAYPLTVTVTDGGTPSRSVDVVVTVTISDVNDVTPSCSDASPVTMREDATGTVASLTCTDTDSGASGTLTYSIVTVNGVAGDGPFAVNPSTGVVSIGTNLDFETASNHIIIFRVEDNAVPALTTSTSLQVVVTDVNEAAPVFSGTPFNLNMAESEVPGFLVLQVTATDADTADSITYSLTDDTNVQIASISGDITLKTAQDREMSAAFTTDVCATDSGSVDAIKSSCTTITVTVTDVNDNSPVFNPGTYTADIDENSAATTVVATVTATDSDAGAFGTVTYSITAGNTDSVFTVDPTGGAVSVQTPNTFLDYERTTSFSLTVTATDGGGLTTDTTVSITVNPINENTPTFTPASSTETVAENAVSGFQVIDLGAITADTDTGPDGDITFSILSGADNKFSINPSTGVVTVSGVLDIESVPSYTITVQATDSGTNPSALVGTYTLTVTLTDYNDKTPSCTENYYSASIPETATPSTSVMQTVCTDLDDTSPNSDLTYTETGGDVGNLFDVDANTGLVSVATGASFDRETTASFLLDITVQDGGTPALSVDIQVYVSISDVNDVTPAFTSDPYPATVAEGAAAGTAVVTVVATDTDLGTNGEVVYSITTGNDLGHFILDAGTGVLSVQTAPDRETLDSYTLEVMAQDRGTPSLSSTSKVTITVTDINDSPPVCSSSIYTATIAEDTATTTSIAAVACTDADIAPNNNVQYTITAGYTGSVFAVGLNSGDVTVAAALDAETLTSYTLTVQASDGTLTTDVVVVVTVTDVNEHTPVFAPVGPYSETFPEDTVFGTTIKDIGATDDDVSDTVLIYSIASGNDDAKFWINPVTGVVVLQGALDKEWTPTYSLSLEVSDGTGAGTFTATTILTVIVSDINDNDPVCNPAQYTNTIDEDAVVGTVVSSLVCTDADTDASPTIAYSITVGNGDGKFNIDAASGIITLVNTLDYETKISYALGVQVSDQGTPLRTITVSVNVDVGPVNEFDPVFAAVTPVSISEDSNVGTSVYTVAATDADTGGLHGTVRYSIVSGDAQGQFYINEGTGEVTTVKPLDRESLASYTLTVRATDDFAGSGNERSTDTTLTVTIDDVNDNIPIFSPIIYTRDVLETAPSGSTIVTVTSSDSDDTPNATPVYAITGGNTGSVFTFVGDELLLDPAKTLDYETVALYTLDISVSDSGTPLLSSSGKVIVTVLPSNEHPPVPAVPNDSITLSELTPVGTNFYNGSATDADAGTDGQFTWSISGTDVPGTFFCTTNGEIYTSSFLDYDTPPNTYNITVQAEDAGGLTGSFWLGVTLLDENDETPTFTEAVYKPFVDENVATGTTVVQVTAVDIDSGVNGQVTYSITSGDATFFTIHPTTGEVQTAAALDYETRTTYFLILEAVDRGTPALSSVGSVLITVNDLNDNPPVFSPDTFSVSLSEDAVLSASVTTVYAQDADSAANNNNKFTYSLTDTFFEVNPTTGQISTKAALDREAIPTHTLTIRAIDQGPTPLTGTAVVTVNLDDVNDNDPVISGTYDVNLGEDDNVGKIVFTIAATDADLGVNAELEYVIVSGNTDTDFTIESGSGIVTISNTLDRERTAFYNPVIHVIDNGAIRRTGSVTTTITIDDINDNNPIFTTSPYTFNIAENVPIGSTVGAILATDADALVNAALTYDIVVFYVGDASHFSLHTSSGEITTNAAIDRETISTYSIQCRAKDGGSPQLSGVVNVTINIDDLNDNAPIFSPNVYNGTVAENSVVGTSILTLAVTDADEHNGAITLSIDTATPEGVRGDTFLEVNSATGVVSVKSVIDRETDASFTITIVATDNGTVPFTDTAVVYITVTDENDNTPVFSNTFYNTEIAYTGTCDSTILTLTATDADSGDNGAILYYLSSNPYGFNFAVASSTGVLSLQSPVSVNTKYVLEASASDSGTPSRISDPVAALRVDTFDPSTNGVRVRLLISKADFLLREAQFISQFQTVLQGPYPNCLVRVWCIQERSGTAVPAPTRRRLLASSPVDVNLIVLTDNTTESQSNLGETKTFLASSEVTAVTTTGPSGAPSGALQGAAWDYYQIESVTPYQETVTPWYQTTEGIIFIVLACILAIILITVTIVAIICCRKKKRPVTPTRELIEEKRPNQRRMFVSRAAVPDLDLKDPKKHPPPAVVALPMPAKAGKPRVVETAKADDTYWGAPPNKEEPPQRPIYTPRTASAPRTPRSILLTQKEDSEFFIKNRHFDGRAIDPVSGRVYEYSTKTNERKWLSTAEGNAVVGSLDSNV